MITLNKLEQESTQIDSRTTQWKEIFLFSPLSLSQPDHNKMRTDSY
jgi:hypothetical protein